MKTSPAKGVRRMPMTILGATEINVPMSRKCDYGYRSRTIPFWSAVSGSILTFSIPARTRKGQRRSGKLILISGMSGGTIGKKAIKM
jgi:hypothetical protein